MKKILFIIVVSFLVGFNVEAYESKNVYYRNDINSFCDEEGNVYRAYVLMYRARPMYFLNMSTDYNLTWSDYYEVSINDTKYPNEIKKYAASGIYSSNKYHNMAIQLLLWQKLYPDKNLKMCKDASFIRAYIKESQDIVKSILNGPTFEAEITQEINETKEYEYTYLNYFTLIDSDDLVIKIDGSKIQITGAKPGEYEVIFKRKQLTDTHDDMILTDGTNYLLVYPSVTDEEYKVRVVIKDNSINDEITGEITPDETVTEELDAPVKEEKQDEIVVVDPDVSDDESIIIELEDTFYISSLVFVILGISIYFGLHKKI